MTNPSDSLTVNASSVSSLLSNPGPSGITLVDAITATNNDPGSYTINFSPKLEGATIVIGPTGQNLLPVLLGGNVVIDGEIGVSSTPGITLENNEGSFTGSFDYGFGVASSGNTIEGFIIKGFGVGITFVPAANDTTYSDNTVSGNVFEGILGDAISLVSSNTFAWPLSSGHIGLRSGVPEEVNWSGTVIQDNNATVLGSPPGANGLQLSTSLSGEFDQTEIIDNNFTVEGSGAGNFNGISIIVTEDHGSVLNTVIADNTIKSGGYSSIFNSTGGLAAAPASSAIMVSEFGDFAHVQGLTITGNHITLPAPGGGSGIGLADGGASFTNDSTIKDAWILDNTINGPGLSGFGLGAETGTGDSIQNVYILGNALNMSAGLVIPGESLYLNQAIVVLAASGPIQASFGNNVTNLYIGSNTIVLAKPLPQYANVTNLSDILVTAGSSPAYDNLVTGTYVFNNYLDGGGGSGLQIWGAWTDGPGNDTGNVVSQVQVWCNLVPRPDITAGGIGTVSIEGGQGGGNSEVGKLSYTTNNTVEDVLLSDNLVGGVLNDYQITNNSGPDSFGNFVTDVTINPLNVTTTSTSTATITQSSTITSTTSVTSTLTTTTTLKASTVVSTTQAAEFPAQAIPMVVLVLTGTVLLMTRLMARSKHLSSK